MTGEGSVTMTVKPVGTTVKEFDGLILFSNGNHLR